MRRLPMRACFRSGARSWGAGISSSMPRGGWRAGDQLLREDVLDVDLLQMVSGIPRAPGGGRATLGLEAVRDVGPGGIISATPHTQARYRRRVLRAILSDWRNFESWQEDGIPTAMEKATRVWKECLAAYEAPPLDPAVARSSTLCGARQSEGGFKTDFLMARALILRSRSMRRRRAGGGLVPVSRSSASTLRARRVTRSGAAGAGLVLLWPLGAVADIPAPLPCPIATSEATSAHLDRACRGPAVLLIAASRSARTGNRDAAGAASPRHECSYAPVGGAAPKLHV